jgi:N-acetylglutamate synthase-like GNAT family acetyltransferase
VILKVTDKIVIRKYRPIDKESCRGLWRELTEWHRQLYEDPHIGGLHPEDYFDKHLKKVGADLLWVALIDYRVVGLVGLMVEEEEAEVEPLIVSQPYRNRGIGRRLLETVIVEVRRLDVRFLSVKPVARNIETIKFVHKQGFKNIGQVELFMDLSKKQWKKGLNLFDLQFNF